MTIPTFQSFMEKTDIAAAVTQNIFHHFTQNFAQRAKEGKGYSVAANIGKAEISIEQYFTHKVYQKYDVHAAITEGKEAAQIIEEINSIIDMLAADPKTPPNDVRMDKEIEDYYASRGAARSDALTGER